ncbi:Endonuclease/exonuclease/phosphatase [Mrakia frigida]|uniref:inositol phosphosphingolipid phospholipase n=1 Tax=Mrakia frigida TaxID=29902 RepID=UPI003FCBF051
MSSSPAELQILSLNCWALKPVSKFRHERIRAIADVLASSPQYDLVVLQEIWVHEDFDHVRDRVRSVLPFTKFFFTGALGSGLAILSRHPLLSSLTIPYHLTGRPLGFGDFFVNKAAGSIVIEHPSLGEVEVFTTHMHAGGPEGYELGNSYRSSQAWRLSNEIRRASSQGRYVIIGGDFNVQSDELPYDILRDHGAVVDAWKESHSDGPDHEGSCSNAREGMEVDGMTVDSPLNTWTAGKNIPPEVQRKFGKRLDYIFHRGPTLPSRYSSLLDDLLPSTSSSSSTPPHHLLFPTLKCVESEVVLDQLVPGHDFSYSDHFGLRAKFIIVPPPSSTNTKTNSHTDLYDPSSSTQQQPYATEDSRGESPSSSTGSGGSASSSTPLRTFISLSQTQNTLTKLHTLVRHHRIVHAPQAKSMFYLVPCALLLLLALTTSSAFLPSAFFSPIFAFAGGLVGFGGCVALIVGFVWGRWEANGLRRVEEEVEEELVRLGGSGGGRSSG